MEKKRRRNIVAGLAGLVTALAVWLVVFGLPGSRVDYTAFAHTYDLGGGPLVHVEIDTQIDAGGTWCNPVDPVNFVVGGGPPTQVAVCVTDSPSALGSFTFEVVYSDHNLNAPEVDCGGNGDLTKCGTGNTGLDDNPDANTGGTTFGVSVPGPDLGGSAWDCGAFGFAEPQADTDATDSTTNGVAKIGCLETTGGGTMTTGPLAVIDFDTLGFGAEHLALQNVQITDNAAVEIGSCNPVLTTGMACFDGDLVKAEPPDVEVTKTCDDQVLVDGTITCDVHVENIGAGSALGVELDDAEVAGTSLDFQSLGGPDAATCAADFTAGVGGGIAACDLGNMAPSDTFDFTLTITAAGPAESINTNEATADVTTGLPDDDPSNNTDSADIHEFEPDIQVNKVDSTLGPTDPGDGWDFRLYDAAGCSTGGGALVDSGTSGDDGAGTLIFENVGNASTLPITFSVEETQLVGYGSNAPGPLNDPLPCLDVLVDGSAKIVDADFDNSLLVAQEASDEGARALPDALVIAVGDSRTVNVEEDILVTDAGPNPSLIHNWDADTDAGGGALTNVDWDQASAQVDAPANVQGAAADPNGDTPTEDDLLSFTTENHVNGATSVSADLAITCVAPGTETIDLSLDFVAANALNTPSVAQIDVRCTDKVEMVKQPDIHNLWLCEGQDCDPDNGEGSIVIDEWVLNADGDPEGVGAFEFQVKFDHKVFEIEVNATDWLYENGRIPGPIGIGGCAATIINENSILFGCVSKDDPDTPGNDQGATSNGVAAQLTVLPEPDLKYRLTPGQENGVVRVILDENCELADIFGDPLSDGSVDELGRPILLPGIVTGGLVESCTDVTLTVRILEGDLNLDCVVDVVDDQLIAYRYGSFFGNLLYDPWYDLEPALKDFDVDIKDLQKVFGRNGSTCAVPIPDIQDPLPPPP